MCNQILNFWPGKTNEERFQFTKKRKLSKVSRDKGFDGYVAFDSKTVLIEHYKQTLGATHLIRQRMFVDPVAAEKLISRYFKS